MKENPLEQCTRCERFFEEKNLIEGLCGLCHSGRFSQEAADLARELRSLPIDAGLFPFVLRIQHALDVQFEKDCAAMCEYCWGGDAPEDRGEDYGLYDKTRFYHVPGGNCKADPIRRARANTIPRVEAAANV